METGTASAQKIHPWTDKLESRLPAKMSGNPLSFLAPADQQKYEMIFKQSSLDGKYMSGEVARNVLSQSNLDGQVLARIWDLSNVTQTSQLAFPEFAMAMYLTSMKMTGKEIPISLPEHIRTEIRNAIYGTTPPSIVPTPTGAPQGFSPGASSQLVNYTPQIQSQPTFQPSFQNTAPTPNNLSLQGNLATPQMAMPTGMYQNNLAFADGMMPNAAGQLNQFHSMSNKTKIPWAVSSEEKERYSKVFNAWDPDRKGYLPGDKAREIFLQSGLAENILRQIWTLSDPDNKGKLNLDEFSVAMHLIYRKLNGYDVPTTLPPELIPPSTRQLMEIVETLKNTNIKDMQRKKTLNALSGSSTPTRSFLSSSSSSPTSRSLPGSPVKERNSAGPVDDSDVGYVSSARRIGPDRTRGSQSPSSMTSSYGYRSKTTRIGDLRSDIEASKRRVRELEEQAEAPIPKSYEELHYRDQKDIDEIKNRVKQLEQQMQSADTGDLRARRQQQWTSFQENTAELMHLADAERATTVDVHDLVDILRNLYQQIYETEDDLKDQKVAAIETKVKNAANQPLPLDIVGTGPGGEVTESDRIRAKAKAMVAARMGKITGKSPTGEGVDRAKEIRQAEQECEEFKMFVESERKWLQEQQETLDAIRTEIHMIGFDVRKQDSDRDMIHEMERFEQGQKVAPDLEAFIEVINHEARVAQTPDVDPTFTSRFPSLE